MKTSTLIPVLSAVLLSTLNPQLSTCLAQGSLTPPGAPGPTFKTLQQVEPRTAITNATAVTISAAGSYYLTTNITVAAGNAITISADNVTLDLNGFTIASTEVSPTGTGILLSGDRKHIQVLNGHIKGSVTFSGGVFTGSGFLNGIYYSGGEPKNARVSGVSVSGCALHGINIGNSFSTIVESCIAQTVGGEGIHAVIVSESTGVECVMTAVYGTTVRDCNGYTTSSADGVFGWSVQNCYGFSLRGGNGINGHSVANCYGQSASGDGVTAVTAHNCEGVSTGGGRGVFADTAENCNGTSATGTGVSAPFTALNCRGSSGTSFGVSAGTAQNCYGIGRSRSVSANCAQNCYGASTGGSGGIGLLALYIAQNCVGHGGTGTGLDAPMAIGCTGLGGLRDFSVNTHQYFCGSGANPYP